MNLQFRESIRRRFVVTEDSKPDAQGQDRPLIPAENEMTTSPKAKLAPEGMFLGYPWLDSGTCAALRLSSIAKAKPMIG